MLLLLLLLLHLDDGDQEPLLVLLVHRPTDRSDGPAQRVEVLPGPLGAVHLVVELLSHDALRVCIVQVSEVHCRNSQSSILVSGVNVCLLEE